MHDNGANLLSRNGHHFHPENFGRWTGDRKDEGDLSHSTTTGIMIREWPCDKLRGSRKMRRSLERSEFGGKRGGKRGGGEGGKWREGLEVGRKRRGEEGWLEEGRRGKAATGMRRGEEVPPG
ncbi:uncharacterized protein BO95DRAFT_172045 [Aspergillus brunneoviolaceus CBS 621.78]|uniref:Uncharacterized protein n=1 Tax=Aspergillus brunneoviolaceus CBS 621.78 TaxID=1450534 RepID=A0ACD1G5C6_9EURO|nr:hypothetical protein BO95DRAFT_172045 [Aspergillus brunneoviolaceus CBS 621.78]RAH44424.1 hypothetical protein BO95DRAFT_172045 [Aspergillus brunneoviolaceus CBS 621.78]